MDQVFCLRGEKDLDMSIIGFTVRLTWHTGSHQHIQEISFFLYKFAFHSALQTNPYRSSPSTSLSLYFLTQTCTLVLCALAICYLQVRGVSFSCPEHIIFMPSWHREPRCVNSVMEILFSRFFFFICIVFRGG